MEQYSRKNSLEFHGIPDEVNMCTDQVVCKIAQAIGVEIQENDIEISHRIGRKRGDKPVLAKFVSHKVKSRIYKARTNLKAISVQSLFPGPGSELCNNQNPKSGPKHRLKPRSAVITGSADPLKFGSKSRIQAKIFTKSADP